MDFAVHIKRPIAQIFSAAAELGLRPSARNDLRQSSPTPPKIFVLIGGLKDMPDKIHVNSKVCGLLKEVFSYILFKKHPKTLPLAKYLQNNYNIIMKEIVFSWDSKKALSNQEKHGVSFEEAKTVFYDPCALVIGDPDHSDNEERFVILGMSLTQHLLVVCHCYRESDSVVRIISARKAVKKEKCNYRRPV